MKKINALIAVGFCLFSSQSIAQSTASELIPPRDPAFSSHWDNYFIIDKDADDAKFQISIKYRIFDRLFPEIADNYLDKYKLHLTFTKKSVWEIGGPSAPFKDSNFRTGLMLLSTNENRTVQIGWDHESNGKDRDDSRSVNRAYAMYRCPVPFIDTNNKLQMGVTAWHITRESGNNSDIKDFIGNFEPFLEYQSSEGQRGENFIFRVTGKKGSNSDRLGVQFDAAVPWAQIPGLMKINERLGYMGKQFTPSFYFQYHDAFAEDLLDYNKRSKQFRAGLLLSY